MRYKAFRILLLTGVCVASSVLAQSIVGLKSFELPEWFKVSFLEIHDDAAEAAEAGKHLMIFFHLANCPYCERMLKESFVTGAPLAESIGERFDVVAIDLEGDLEVIDGEEETTEQEYSRKLGVAYTPAMVFYDSAGEPIIKVVGYRAPEAFATVLDYVSERAYADDRYLDFGEYVSVRGQERWDLREHPRFARLDDLASVAAPLMVIIEDRSCVECERMHEQMLELPEVQEYLDAVTVVRIDAGSSRTITVPDGRQMSEREFVSELGVTYRPGVVFYDGHERVLALTGALNSYHFSEAVRYVAGNYHREYDRWGAYLRNRRDQIVADGGIVDYSFPN